MLVSSQVCIASISMRFYKIFHIANGENIVVHRFFLNESCLNLTSLLKCVICFDLSPTNQIYQSICFCAFTDVVIVIITSTNMYTHTVCG